MQFPWQRSRDGQLDLLDEASGLNRLSDPVSPHPRASELAPIPTVSPRPTSTASAANGRPLQVAISLLHQDPDNPRTEFAEENVDDLARDIREHGILQPIVVHPADAAGRYRIHFGALRLRAARKAGLRDVPCRRARCGGGPLRASGRKPEALRLVARRLPLQSGNGHMQGLMDRKIRQSTLTARVNMPLTYRQATTRHDDQLHLRHLTLLVGANDSGKSQTLTSRSDAAKMLAANVAPDHQ